MLDCSWCRPVDGSRENGLFLSAWRDARWWPWAFHLIIDGMPINGSCSFYIKEGKKVKCSCKRCSLGAVCLVYMGLENIA